MRKSFLELEVLIPREESGLVLLRCEACGHRFGVESLAEEMWCPVCGQRMPLLRLLPPEQRSRFVHELRLRIWGKDELS